jgi:hypothetical protein
MPTHFHFLVLVKTKNIVQLKRKFGVFLSAYTKAINKQCGHHGSLFQQHTRTRHIDKENYLLTLITYIHQNPLRAGLTQCLEDWEFSSFLDYIDMRCTSIIKNNLLKNYFDSIEDFKQFSNEMLQSIDHKYWA